MEANDLIKIAQKLSASGMAEHLAEGQEAVPVSLMIPERTNIKSREERKAYLKRQFSERLSRWEKEGLEVDFNSLSVSGQTINAKMGIDSIKPLFQYLTNNGLKIHPNINTYVV